nr:RecName: Full=Putative antimicrobial protein 3; AltName: Full=Cm-p2 [Cenchritis muricatus]
SESILIVHQQQSRSSGS